MATTRVSNAQVYRGVLRNVNAGTRSLADLQEKLSSGRRVNRPSDDPTAASLAISFRIDIAVNQQHQRATADALARMNAAEAALSGATDTLQRARELAVQAGSPGISAQQLQSLGQEVDQLLQHMVQLGNSSFAGQYVFSGHRTQTPAFSTTLAAGQITGVTYAGDAGVIFREVGIAANVDINVKGDDAFGNAFTTLMNLRDQLNIGNAAGAQAQVANLDTDLDTVMQSRGTLGARISGVEAAQSILENAIVDLQKQKADNEEIDLVDIVVKLNAQQNVYQASLASTAKVIQPSLIDFLR